MLKALSVWALQNNETRAADSLLTEARERGFRAVEVAIGKRGLVTPESTRVDCQAVVTVARQQGMTITSLASGLGWSYPLTSDEPAVRGRGVEVIAESLQAAAWLGLHTLLVVPGYLAPLDDTSGRHVPYDVAMDRMRDGLAQLVPVAEEVGVTLAVENVWNRVLLSPLEMRHFIEGFGSERVGVYLDVGNVIAFGYPEDWIRILGPHIACVHFKDFKRAVGTLDGFCDLGEGDVNWPAVMGALRKAGYDGPCVAEFFGLNAAALDKLSQAMDAILAI